MDGQFLLEVVYLILPAYFANMAPVIFNRLGWLKSLDKPIDAGGKLGSESIFGSSKTWRGIVSAVIFGVVVAGIQALLFQFSLFRDISWVYYPKMFLLFGVLAGLGAIVGDLVKSFFKRRLGLSSGQPWIGFDQLDFMVGFFVFIAWLVHPSWEAILVALVLTLILHPLVNISGYLLGIKKVYW